MVQLGVDEEIQRLLIRKRPLKGCKRNAGRRNPARGGHWFEGDEKRQPSRRQT
jgi:hypothetical protein